MSCCDLVGAHEDELMTLRYLQLDYAVAQKAVTPGLGYPTRERQKAKALASVKST